MKEKFIQLLKVADKEVRNRMLDAVDEGVFLGIFIKDAKDDPELMNIYVEYCGKYHYEWRHNCHAHLFETDENGHYSKKYFVYINEESAAHVISERLKELKSGTDVYSWHGIYMWEDDGIWRGLFVSPNEERRFVDDNN